MTSNPIVIYGDAGSAPCRSIIYFCACNDIPYEIKLVSLAKAEFHAPEYKNTNPLGKVPCIKDGDFVLPESASILTYLADSRSVADHWYPKDRKKRSEVEKVMSWHGSTLRPSAVAWYWNRVLAASRNLPFNPTIETEYGLKHTKMALAAIENVFLASGDWLAGGDDISIADLHVVGEVEHLQIVDVMERSPMSEDLFAEFPKVRAWMKRVAARCEPHHAPTFKALLDRMVYLRGTFVANGKH